MDVAITIIRDEIMSDLKSGKNIKICETVVVSLVLYECETWFFTLREVRNWYYLRTV
jgi:hypothetical protein